MSSTWRWSSRGPSSAMPADHPARRHLRLISQALRSDLHFLARHPTTLFQCLWNRCWWYDCPAAAAHYDPPPGGWPADGPPWSRPGADRLATLLESWRAAKQRRTPAFTWLRSLRPPPFPLGGAGWPASAGTTGSSVAFDRRAADRQRVVGQDGAGLGRGLRRRAGLPPRARRRGHERGVRPGGAADRQRVGRQDGAGLGRGLRRRAGLPPRARRRGHERGVRPGGSADRQRVGDQTVRVWDAASGAELACLRGHDGWVRSVAFDREGRRIVSGSGDKTVRVWDAATGAELACLRGHDDAVESVAFDREGRRIVSGSDDETVRVWDAATGAELACLRGHEGDGQERGVRP